MVTKVIECYWGGKIKKVENFYSVDQLKDAIARIGMPAKMWLVMRDENHDVIKSDIIPACLTYREIQKRFIEY